MKGDIFEVTATAFAWRPSDASGWHFLPVDPPVATEIRYAALGLANSFGAVHVTATIGATRWKTSLFPHKETGGYLLPLKADIRRLENIVPGTEVSAELEVGGEQPSVNF
jgi:hypothetical protein